MKTVGIVSCGELGARLAGLLVSRGIDVVTCPQGRSARTQAAGRQCGAGQLPSLRDVVRASDIFVSVVHPDGAEGLASLYLDLCDGRPGQIFVDLNSVSPGTISRMAGQFEGQGQSFVDAALVGPAAALETTSTLYLSGDEADDIAFTIGPSVRTRVLGAEPGLASSLKMLVGGMNKGLAALFIELALAAEVAGALPIFLAEYEANYPAVMRLIERMVPTYAQHARRRGEEMRELESMLRSLGVEPSVIGGARALIGRMAGLRLEPCPSSSALIGQTAAAWSFKAS